MTDQERAFQDICDELGYPYDNESALRAIARLRATLLNIQAVAELGFQIDCAKLSERCRHALAKEG